MLMYILNLFSNKLTRGHVLKGIFSRDSLLFQPQSEINVNEFSDLCCQPKLAILVNVRLSNDLELGSLATHS